MNTPPRLESLKAAYRIPAAWRDLGLNGEPGNNCSSPFREDRNPSFSVFDDGMRWHDFGTGEGGDVLDFVAKARGFDIAQALRFVEERVGMCCERKRAEAFLPPKWPQLRRGTFDELNRLNRQRGFSIKAMRDAEGRGFLHFGTHWSYDFWGVTDTRQQLIELRRITDEFWRAYGRLSERKAHCIGSGKAWPIGILEGHPFPKIAFCEGAPDFLAAITVAFAEAKDRTVAPVAMLGIGTSHIAADALPFFRDKHVRLFPHLDEAGRAGMRRWAKQIAEAGALCVDAFDLSGLKRDDGGAGKDLADFCRIDSDCLTEQRKFQELLP